MPLVISDCSAPRQKLAERMPPPEQAMIVPGRSSTPVPRSVAYLSGSTARSP